MDDHPYIDFFFPTPLNSYRIKYKVWTVNHVTEVAPQEATPVSAVVSCKIVLSPTSHISRSKGKPPSFSIIAPSRHGPGGFLGASSVTSFMVYTVSEHHAVNTEVGNEDQP